MRLLTNFATLFLAGCTAGEPHSYDQARDLVAAQLKDPDSAEFGNLRPGKGKVVCGEVNARNSFGGFAGMTPFAVDVQAGIASIYPTTYMDWEQRGEYAEMFEAVGCSIGPDHEKALDAAKALREGPPPPPPGFE